MTAATDISSPQKHAPIIATVIVNYGAAALIIENFSSLLEEYKSFPGSKVYIVDNASPGDDAVMLSAFAQSAEAGGVVEFIASDENGGFAKGNNLAMRKAFADNPQPDFIFLLNPDAYIRSGAIKTLYRFLQENPRAGLAGSRLEGVASDPQISAFRYFSIASEFETAAKTGLISKLLSPWRIAPDQEDVIRTADWVCGAAVLIRREVFESAGLFDEAYFLYFEETDFMLQAKRKGWETWYVPESRAVHLVGQSTGVIDGKLEKQLTPAYWYQSRTHYFKKNHGRLYAFLADVAWLSGAMIYYLRFKLTGRETTDLWSSIKRFCKSQFGGGLENDTPGGRSEEANQ